MARKLKGSALIDARIERAYRRSCSGLQINIMDIPKIFAHARGLIAAGYAGANDDELAKLVGTFVIENLEFTRSNGHRNAP